MYFKRWLLFELVASALARPAECQGSLLPWRHPASACKMAQAVKFSPGSREAIFSTILLPPPTHTQGSLWGLGLQVQCCLVLWLQRQCLEITCEKNTKQHMKRNKTWPPNTQSVSQRVKDSALNQPACTDNFLLTSCSSLPGTEITTHPCLLSGHCPGLGSGWAWSWACCLQVGTRLP